MEDAEHCPGQRHSKTELGNGRRVVGEERPAIIFGGLREKDLRKMLSTLSKIATRFFIVPVQSRRAAAPAEIQSLVPANVPSSTCTSVAQALQCAQQFDEMILVTGSLFLIGEAIAHLQPIRGNLQPSDQ